MAKIDGLELLVYVGATAVGSSTNATLDISQSLLDTTTKDSEGWVEHLEGERNWSVSCDYFYDATDTMGFEELTDYIINHSGSVTLKLSQTDAGSTYWTGTAFIESTSLQAAKNETAGGSCSFIGSGALSKATVSS